MRMMKWTAEQSQPLAWPPRMRLWDRTGEIGFEPVLASFARDELLCRRTGAGGVPVLHLWRHPRAFVMGLRDSRLPAAESAKAWLRDLGYSTAVRNSGGAAVPLDLGVLNVSLILPKAEGSINFRDDFGRMVELLRGAFAHRTADIRQGEVEGSYCPGEFDLSIAGRKLCGIAQRRHASAIVVQAFLLVEGAGAERAALARAFYGKAAGSCSADIDYPQVRPETMGSLSELTGRAVSAPEAAADIVRRLRAMTELEPVREQDLPTGEDIAGTARELESRYASRS
jgi:octanoyl-[GcvH]:protein N-octanoyltransferase